jgi:hypothetical protein
LIMTHKLLFLVQRRRFWLVLLLTVWLLCSGQVSHNLDV